MYAKNYLEKAINIEERIKNKNLEIEQWRTIATKTSASAEGERVQTSTSLHKMEDAAIKIVELEQEAKEMRSKLIEKKAEIIKTIDQVEDAESYSVLHLRYVQGMTLEKIAETKEISVSTVERKLNSAYELVQVILEKREKDGK